ncbi:hypothetical protein GCM10009037_22180 [Halarchaeum grantii]|uniref:Uncharacterized protein n=1 Tax=Halarchaeum grantii TaxID=1193105 RepID=A0A830EYU2_9EURY|nr:hypothetical protein [Halarchaeum grantii]GGL38149.1 hypothetical protein GCM10009037_22180 [Halarchaeum grantii]
MQLTDALRTLLDAIDGYEDDVAAQISKRTSVTETQVTQGIELAREELGMDANEEESR